MEQEVGKTKNWSEIEVEGIAGEMREIEKSNDHIPPEERDVKEFDYIKDGRKRRIIYEKIKDQNGQQSWQKRNEEIDLGEVTKET